MYVLGLNFIQFVAVHVAFGIGATGVPVLIQQTIRITLSFNWAIWYISFLDNAKSNRAIAVTVALTGAISVIASFGDVPDDDFQTLHPQAFQDPQGPRRNSYRPPSLHKRPIEQTIVIIISSCTFSCACANDCSYNFLVLNHP